MTPRAELPEMMHFLQLQLQFRLFPLQSCPFPLQLRFSFSDAVAQLSAPHSPAAESAPDNPR
jgi:hypothetical protein